MTVDGTSEGVIIGITGATMLTISTANLPASNISNKGYEIREKPVSTLGDTNYGAGEIFGVDVTEQQVVNAKTGDLRKYAPPHAGWVGITTYVDGNGNFRVKTEVLVAGSSISGDSTEDAKLADS